MGFSERALSTEGDLPARQQIEHKRPALAHRGSVAASGRAYDPAGRATVEARRARDGHDEVDLALRMHVVRARDVVHVDDVDREAVEVVRGLEDPAVADAAALVVAQPSRGDALLAALLESVVGRAPGAVLAVQPGIEAGVQRPAGELCGERGDLGAEGF